MYKPEDGVGSSGGGGLGGALVVVLGEMLVTSWSSIDQELPTFSRLWLLEAKLRLWRLPNLPPPLPPPEDASDDEAGVTGDSRCLMWSILQGASHFENRRSIRKL